MTNIFKIRFCRKTKIAETIKNKVKNRVLKKKQKRNYNPFFIFNGVNYVAYY